MQKERAWFRFLWSVRILILSGVSLDGVSTLYAVLMRGPEVEYTEWARVLATFSPWLLMPAAVFIGLVGLGYVTTAEYLRCRYGSGSLLIRGLCSFFLFPRDLHWNIHATQWRSQFIRLEAAGTLVNRASNNDSFDNRFEIGLGHRFFFSS